MHNKNTAGSRAIGAETNPLAVGRPARDRAGNIPELPSLATSTGGCNANVRDLILRPNEHHRPPVRRDVAVRVASRTGTQCRPLRPTVAGNAAEAQRFRSPGVEENRIALRREARINLRNISGCKLPRPSPARRNDPQMPQAVGLVARIGDVLAV